MKHFCVTNPEINSLSSVIAIVADMCAPSTYYEECFSRGTMSSVYGLQSMVVVL